MAIQSVTNNHSQLKFRGEIITPIYPMDDVYAVQTALESLPTIGGVVVTFKFKNNMWTNCMPLPRQLNF